MAKKKSRVLYNRDGIVITEYELNRSYNAYLRNRAKWQEKGFSLDPVTSKDTYLYHLADIREKNQGIKAKRAYFEKTQQYDKLDKLEKLETNYARGFAYEDLPFSVKKARKLAKFFSEELEEDEIPDTISKRERSILEEKNERIRFIKENYGTSLQILNVRERGEVFKDYAKIIDPNIWDYKQEERLARYRDVLEEYRGDFEATIYPGGKRR